ncbi:MAG TPA: hypothetical protein VD997_07655 [Phycisphaerales bacterium]|nr:hypothetical protein [Phycisphaerales bacterium]
MPWGDWQFWVVTAVAACALVFVVREVLPFGWKRKKKGKAASLTVEGKAIRKP